MKKDLMWGILCSIFGFVSAIFGFLILSTMIFIAGVFSFGNYIYNKYFI